MDEPLSNLDAKLRVQMRIEISKLHENLGATMINVTHDQTEAMTLGTRIVVKKDGFSLNSTKKGRCLTSRIGDFKLVPVSVEEKIATRIRERCV